MKKFAFVFPGQGSQSVGMLAGWGAHPVLAETLKEASDALGEDLGKLIGKSGRTVGAVRVLLSAFAAKNGRRAMLEIVE